MIIRVNNLSDNSRNLFRAPLYVYHCRAISTISIAPFSIGFMKDVKKVGDDEIFVCALTAFLNHYRMNWNNDKLKKHRLQQK